MLTQRSLYVPHYRVEPKIYRDSNALFTRHHYSPTNRAGIKHTYMQNKNNEGVRINKYISDYGFCSRREADKLIEDMRVTINNRLATPGDRVCENDDVRIDGEHLAFVPREARPKKHRWGPPRNPEATEAESSQRAGKRGAARNVKPRATTPKTTSPATKGTAKAQKPATKSIKRK